MSLITCLILIAVLLLAGAALLPLLLGRPGRRAPELPNDEPPTEETQQLHRVQHPRATPQTSIHQTNPPMTAVRPSSLEARHALVSRPSDIPRPRQPIRVHPDRIIRTPQAAQTLASRPLASEPGRIPNPSEYRSPLADLISTGWANAIDPPRRSSSADCDTTAIRVITPKLPAVMPEISALQPAPLFDTSSPAAGGAE